MTYRRRLQAATLAAMTHWCKSAIAWGADDCLMGLADIYREALGVDPAAHWRGRYNSEAGSLAVMGHRGVLGATAKGAKSLGWKRIAPKRALPGDLGVARVVAGHAGVIRYGGRWIGRRAFGFSALDTKNVVAAWRVTAKRQRAEQPAAADERITNATHGSLLSPLRKPAPAANVFAPAGIRWIASYPRSGSTWVRAMLHQLIMHGDARRDWLNHLAETSINEADRSTFGDLVAEDAASRDLEAVQAARPLLHARLAAAGGLVKTHSTAFARSAVGPSIYLIRDPRDVAVSYAALTGLSIDTIIGRMADGTTFGMNTRDNVAEAISSWSNNAASWAALPQVLIVRFEDLRSDPAGELLRIARHFEVPARSTEIAAAVAAAAFDKLKDLERRCGFVERPAVAIEFFRVGRAGAWSEVLNADQAAAIVAAQAATMERFGYLEQEIKICPQ